MKILYFVTFLLIIALSNVKNLAAEDLRLSHHEFWEKDKSFNTKFETDFEPSLPKIEIIPKNISKVLLNLINNAFYAVAEKQKTPTGSKTPSGLEYKPTVTVTTKNLGDRIEILVKDNGNSIPEEIKSKIFKPFFPTKPTGQVTGLGLSLSYDVVKAHGGELKVVPKEGEGSEFIIQLMTM